MIKGGNINKSDPVLTPLKGVRAKALNDGSLIGALDYQVLEGGIDIVREIYQLPLGGFSSIVNMRPLRPGFMLWLFSVNFSPRSPSAFGSLG